MSENHTFLKFCEKKYLETNNLTQLICTIRVCSFYVNISTVSPEI
jgi:hypothetical protein